MIHRRAPPRHTHAWNLKARQVERVEKLCRLDELDELLYGSYRMPYRTVPYDTVPV